MSIMDYWLRQLRLDYERAYDLLVPGFGRTGGMARGDRWEPIYHDDHDRLAWIEYLGQVVDGPDGEFTVGLMGNHYHLLI